MWVYLTKSSNNWCFCLYKSSRRAEIERDDGENGMTKKILVVGAHSADFVWRAAGTIATITSQGGSASVVALSYGEKGESGELWKEPNQTVENVKRIRHEEAQTAAEAVGAELHCLDLGDYPLNMTDAAIEQLIGVFLDFQPNIVLTHSPVDPFNPMCSLTSRR
jgi:4-oxalomesaconate hydratase